MSLPIPAPAPSDAPRAAARPSRPLRLKLGALTVALALIPVPVVGGLLLSLAQGALEEQLRELQLAVADEVAAGVEHETTSARDGLETLAGVLLDDTLSADQTVATALRLVEGHAALDQVAIYGEDGAVIDRLEEEEAARATPAQLEEVLRRTAADAGVASSTDTAEGRLLLVVPLRAGERATGYLAAPISLAALDRRVDRIAAHRFGDLPDTLVVVEASGRVVAGSDERGADRAEHPLVRELHGNRFETTYAHQRIYDADGLERVGTLVSLPQRRWGVIVQVPTRVAFEPLRTMRAWVVGTLVAVVILALLLGLFLARSITEPLAALTAFAQRLGRRELGETIEVPTRDELRVLGDALSRASVDLQESEVKVRREEAIRADLGRYVPPEIVDRVVKREQDMRLGGTRETVTVLFADVVAFTPLTESRSPEEVVALLNELFTILTEIVFRHGGTVDKFIGDAVMAIFGAPEPSDDHARRALETAEDMLSWLETGNAAWEERYGITVKLAIGIHTGEAVVGNVGSESRMAYTAIGDVVNVAARLEAIARPNQIVTTAATRAAAGDAFDYVEIGERELSGRKGAIHLYEVRA